jgi:hypothetical protein
LTDDGRKLRAMAGNENDRRAVQTIKPARFTVKAEKWVSKLGSAAILA